MGIAKELKIELEYNDIQRTHRLGKRKKFATKAKPIIARFVSYKKRNEFLFNRSTPKDRKSFKDAFVVEDLTSLKKKLLYYVKKECDGKCVHCHTYNGKIRMKKLLPAAIKTKESVIGSQSPLLKIFSNVVSIWTLKN